MSIEYSFSLEYPTLELLQEICSLNEPCYPVTHFEKQVKHQLSFLGCYAYWGKELVGYKVGFQTRPGYFESFLGFVHSSYRRRGIATHLSQIQHNWCKENGYKYIFTVTAGSNNAMLILNLKAGFHVVGTLLDRGDNHKVLLQKALSTTTET